MRLILIIMIILVFSCEEKSKETHNWNSMMVTATAYNSLAYQTDFEPNITAFGDTLKPGLKYIAVSRDLYRLGLKENTPVKIEGLAGTYLVKDKMHSRWKKKIDIYMGIDVKAAKLWGRKKVCIDYGIPISD